MFGVSRFRFVIVTVSPLVGFQMLTPLGTRQVVMLLFSLIVFGSSIIIVFSSILVLDTQSHLN